MLYEVITAHRLLALGLTTGVLLLAALVVGWVTLARARRSTLLSATRSSYNFV